MEDNVAIQFLIKAKKERPNVVFRVFTVMLERLMME